jgi:hypothetical protein
MVSPEGGAARDQPLEPWTQHFEVRWPSALTFFEHRYEILRGLEEADLLRAFRTSEERIDVRLGDPHHLLAFMATGMSLSALRPSADLGRLQTAADLVLDAVNPDRLGSPRALFQWIAPSSGETYNDARSEAVASALGTPATGRFTDFAALVDGRIDDPPATYHLDAGVAEAGELPFRLSRAAGQLRGASTGHQGVPPSLWSNESFPEFALFCDSRWTLDDAIRGSSWSAASATFDAARNAARATVDGIFKHLDSNGTQEES